MSHPTVFELDVFIRQGSTSAEFERHVSGCDACAARLSRLARRAHPLELTHDEPRGRRLQAAAVALAACLAVLLVRTVSVPSMPTDFRAPEGVHGVASSQGMSMAVADAGPADSGVR
jgi:hypothetical protein